ncbi:hypothetical protein EUAN_15280 [Andreesenia angusta]|uniref:Antitoxin endoAI n=1 Tax=Andreesenia angusta TaxID=39480 RepID=A0A1S1V6Q1_9FIRM|nr:CopG family transcriptional regulator [Andreesenia angusta]OHW62080.1 hypothetical protein EUAN_15280 [Andreesenia angusta]
MAETKKIELEFKNGLIDELEEAAHNEDIQKGKFVREAMKLYLRERRRIKMTEAMKSGYLEMSHINRKLSEDGFSQDIRDFLSYEISLTGCGSF